MNDAGGEKCAEEGEDCVETLGDNEDRTGELENCGEGQGESGGPVGGVPLLGAVAEVLAEFSGPLEVPGEIGLGLGVDFGEPPEAGEGSDGDNDEGGPMPLDEWMGARHGFYFGGFS